MQILLIVSRPAIRDLLTINIKSFLNVDVICRSSINEGIDLLNLLPEIDLIITQYNSDSKDHDLLTDYLSNKDSTTPILVLTSEQTDQQLKEYKNTYFVKENDWEEAIKSCAKILGLSEDILKNRVKSEFTPLPVEYFLNIETSCCDVYIRITKDKDDFQFIKRIHAGDNFSKVVIKRYIEQGLKYFFIPSDQLQNFAISLSNQLVKKINIPIQTEEDIETLGNAFEIATKEILKLGFNSSTVQLTEAIVKSIIDSYQNMPNVSPLLRKILNSRSGYIYQHAHLCTIVASEICTNLNLKGKNHLQKIAFAAVFKDISLVDDESLAQITNFEELEKANLDEEKWDQVFNHALEAAMLVRNFPEAPLDVDTIIKSHHASLNGKGFGTKDAYLKIDFESLIFVVTVEFVNELLRFKYQGGEPRPLIQDLYTKYTSEDAIKIIKALEKSLKKSVSHE